MDDVQSWWEVPCIAHFCSLFRSSFGLLDFDIEDLEEALLTHTVEEVGSSLIQDLIVRLLKGCFNSNKDEITSSNYQMYLRRLFRIKCEEDHNRKNPFDKDIAFHSLPLRTKVEILYDLCDFRLDGDEVQEVLKSLESHSLRVTALGKDSGGSTYWYFYGTRLYREDYGSSPTSSPARKRGKKAADSGNDCPFGSLKDSKWQVVCYTEEDWQLLTRKFKNCKSKHERSLHRTLKEDFLPELPRLFAEREKLQRKRMMEQQLRRSGRNNGTSEGKNSDELSLSGGNPASEDMTDDELRRQRLEQEKADRLLAEEMQREERKARLHLRERRGGGGGGSTVSSGGSATSVTRNNSSTTSTSTTRKSSEANKANNKKKRMTNNSMAACLPPVMEIDSSANSVCSGTPRRDSSRSPSPTPPPSTKSRTVNSNSNNSSSNSSVSSAKKKTYDESDKSNSKGTKSSGTSKTKVRSSVIFSQNEEDVIIGMHKVIEAMKNHRDAWPFVNPVDEDYAPNYYRVISEPMDLQTIEDKLDNQDYSSLEEFKSDFQKIVDNCRKYNGPTSEYTEMVETLEDAFNKAIQRFIIPDESDEEISIEYNTGSERKKPRLMNAEKKSKNSAKIIEHKKENEPHDVKKNTSKSKADKHDKKKRKQQLMRHHSRNSEAMDALTSATAETLKDINKWLGDAPKISEYSPSSPRSISSENLVLRPEKKSEKEIKPAKSKIKNSNAGSKRKLLKKVDHDGGGDVDVDVDDRSSHVPSSDRVHSKEKIKSKKSKLKERLKGKESAGMNNNDGKESKAKHHHHHHHKHHKHNKNHDVSVGRSGKERSESPENSASPVRIGGGVTSSKSSKGHDSSKSQLSRSHSPSVATSKSLSQSHGSSSSQWDNDKSDSPLKKHADPVKSKSSIKRATSLVMGLKNSGTIKRLQGNKLTKFSSLSHQESKMKVSGSGNANAASVYDFVSTPSYGSKTFGSSSEFGSGTNTAVPGNGRESVSEKKRCLLINDSPNGKEGGPKLSLGSVLSTDAIKLGDFKKEDRESDEDDGFVVKEEGKYDKFDDLKAKINSKIRAEDDSRPSKNEEESSSVIKDESEDVDVEDDRKLEPSKGFNREKCMPNLSAWIKAFGGPAKASPTSVQSSVSKKPAEDPKAKFKVLGRAPLDPQEERPKQSAAKQPAPASSTSTASVPMTKSRDSLKSSRGDFDGSVDEGIPGYDHHVAPESTSKRHRSRKMSNSSLSSQSESGSPSCFPNNQDDLSNRMVINPPRWVDEHWGPQSQSPSASSQVSSHSPAGPNSPFSPPMSSPPRTPQTPPWPPAPVRVGFYQDLTSQHSSPEKISESSVASPATPPSVAGSGSGSGGGTPSSRDTNPNGKNYSGYSGSGYAPRYASSIPSPSMGPSSNIPSPSPGISSSVESPGSRMGIVPHSPHSPSVAGGSGSNHPSDYSRVALNPSPSPGMHHSMTSQAQGIAAGPPSSGSTSQSKLQALSPVLRTPSRGESVMNSHGIPPYPVTTTSSGNFMIDGPHPEAAHMHHHHQTQGPPRYPQNLPPAHHQPVSLSQSPGLSAAAAAKLHNHVLGPQGLPPPLSSSSSQPQPSPYPSNPYTSNPRSINVAPSVYNNPMADSRFYKPPSDINLSGTPPLGTSNSTSGSSGSSSKGRKNAAAIAAAHSNDSDVSSSKSSSNPSPSPVNPAAAAAAALESAKLSSELNGFQWPHNLASLSQIVNSIPNPMAVGVPPNIANAYRAHYDKTMATAVEMGKFSRSESSPSYTNLATVAGKSSAELSSVTSVTAASQPEKSQTPNESSSGERRSSSKSESKSSRSQGSSSSSSKSASQPIVPGSPFNFSTLPPDLALYSKEMQDPSSLYTASPPALAHHHRGELYPTSSASFHASFASAARTTAGGVPTPPITPYQIPPFIGSHASPYQPQSSQPFAHSQSPRGIVDPYQQFFPGSPHVMGLLPPSSYSAPYGHPHHSLGFNRPGWI